MKKYLLLGVFFLIFISSCDVQKKPVSRGKGNGCNCPGVGK